MRARRSWGALLGLFGALAGCGRSRPNASTSSTPPAPAYRIAITGASAAGDAVTVEYQVTKDGRPLDAADAGALGPSWTLAGLRPDPVSGLPAWQSYVLTGGQTIASLPPAGPGTPAGAVLTNVKQPGSETRGAVAELGGGRLSYTYQSKLPQGLDPATTLRVGVWLAGTPGTADTSATLDFTPSGAAAASHELVLDQSCNRCHGLVQAHGDFRTGTKLCVTCHTWQDADPDTLDPAAVAGATPATNPNPLDLGRLVHRIHRGKDLPTLYDASTGAPVVGQKYSVVGFRSSEAVYGRIVNRSENQQPATAVAEGVGFPQPLRNCDACHGGAAQGAERFADVSRRTCAGCHPDVWFQSTPIPSGDRVHTPHPAGPQADDTRCALCHDAGSLAEIHVAPFLSPHWNGLTAQLVGVTGMRPGQAPTIVFTLSDRDGVPTPLGAPTPAADPQSPVPRALGLVNLTLSGPTVPDLATGNAPITEAVPLTAAADAQGRFSYTFKAALPTGAAGTWLVGLEARRSKSSTDPGAWPFTGEAVNEWTENPVAYVDTGVGTWPGGAATLRRGIVDPTRCNVCHLQLTAHGDLRHAVEYCVLCHTPDGTDWAQRPKGPGGNTALASTFDGIEERSIHFKVLVHRIHTGAHVGSAELDLAAPHVVYGFRGSVNLLDDVELPGDLARCERCHAGTSWRIESVPSDAPPTVANETATILHAATPAHVAAEPRTLPVTAACMGCHDTGAAQAHATQNTIDGKENCAVCHGAIGFMSVDSVHGLAE